MIKVVTRKATNAIRRFRQGRMKYSKLKELLLRYKAEVSLPMEASTSV